MKAFKCDNKECGKFFEVDKTSAVHGKGEGGDCRIIILNMNIRRMNVTEKEPVSNNIPHLCSRACAKVFSSAVIDAL